MALAAAADGVGLPDYDLAGLLKPKFFRTDGSTGLTTPRLRSSPGYSNKGLLAMRPIHWTFPCVH
jgi:hypothetical protein